MGGVPRGVFRNVYPPSPGSPPLARGPISQPPLQRSLPAARDTKTSVARKLLARKKIEQLENQKKKESERKSSRDQRRFVPKMSHSQPHLAAASAHAVPKEREDYAQRTIDWLHLSPARMRTSPPGSYPRRQQEPGLRSFFHEPMFHQPSTSRAPSHQVLGVNQQRSQPLEEDMIASAARVISGLRISLSTCSMPERLARQMASQGLKPQQLQQLKRSLHQVNQPQDTRSDQMRSDIRSTGSTYSLESEEDREDFSPHPKSKPKKTNEPNRDEASKRNQHHPEQIMNTVKTKSKTHQKVFREILEIISNSKSRNAAINKNKTRGLSPSGESSHSSPSSDSPPQLETPIPNSSRRNNVGVVHLTAPSPSEELNSSQEENEEDMKMRRLAIRHLPSIKIRRDLEMVRGPTVRIPPSGNVGPSTSNSSPFSTVTKMSNSALRTFVHSDCLAPCGLCRRTKSGVNRAVQTGGRTCHHSTDKSKASQSRRTRQTQSYTSCNMPRSPPFFIKEVNAQRTPSSFTEDRELVRQALTPLQSAIVLDEYDDEYDNFDRHSTTPSLIVNGNQVDSDNESEEEIEEPLDHLEKSSPNSETDDDDDDDEKPSDNTPTKTNVDPYEFEYQDDFEPEHESLGSSPPKPQDTDIVIPEAAFASSDSESETENLPRPPPEMQDCIDGILSTLKPRLERMWGPLQEQDKNSPVNKKGDTSETDKNIAALSLQVQALWQRLGNSKSVPSRDETQQTSEAGIVPVENSSKNNMIPRVEEEEIGFRMNSDNNKQDKLDLLNSSADAKQITDESSVGMAPAEKNYFSRISSPQREGKKPSKKISTDKRKEGERQSRFRPIARILSIERGGKRPSEIISDEKYQDGQHQWESSSNSLQRRGKKPSEKTNVETNEEDECSSESHPISSPQRARKKPFDEKNQDGQPVLTISSPQRGDKKHSVEHSEDKNQEGQSPSRSRPEERIFSRGGKQPSEEFSDGKNQDGRGQSISPPISFPQPGEHINYPAPQFDSKQKTLAELDEYLKTQSALEMLNSIAVSQEYLKQLLSKHELSPLKSTQANDDHMLEETDEEILLSEKLLQTKIVPSIPREDKSLQTLNRENMNVAMQTTPSPELQMHDESLQTSIRELLKYRDFAQQTPRVDTPSMKDESLQTSERSDKIHQDVAQQTLKSLSDDMKDLHRKFKDIKYSSNTKRQQQQQTKNQKNQMLWSSHESTSLSEGEIRVGVNGRVYPFQYEYTSSLSEGEVRLQNSNPSSANTLDEASLASISGV